MRRQKKRHVDPYAVQDDPARAESTFRVFHDFPALLLEILDEQPARGPAPDERRFFMIACRAGVMPNNKERHGTRPRGECTA